MSPVNPRRYPARMQPTRSDLFRGFLGIGLVGFGGVLPWARRMVVDQRAWLTPTEFLDLLAFCQFLPGPNVVNLAVAIGTRFRGILGALAALSGLLVMPVMIVVALGTLYARYGSLPVIHHAFTGLAAAATGLVVAMACRIAWPIRAQPLAVAVALAAFAAIALARLPLVPTMLVIAPLSTLLHRRTP